MEEIYRGIYYETAYSGVTLGALLHQHGTVLIDAPLRAEEGRVWRAALLNKSKNVNRLLVNLDAHPDRTLGARVMDCTIIAHHKTAQVFRSRPSVFKGQSAESGSEWETYDEAVGTRWAVPDITFTDSMSIHWGQPDIILEHHPGPMPGAIWAIIPEAGLVFVGDCVMADQPPFLSQADIPSWLESLDILSQKYKNFTVISGRGGPVAYDSIRAQQHILSNIQAELLKVPQDDIPIEYTEIIIPAILKNLEFSAQLEEQYIQRLRHGLIQYFTRHYRPTDSAVEE